MLRKRMTDYAAVTARGVTVMTFADLPLATRYADERGLTVVRRTIVLTPIDSRGRYATATDVEARAQ